MTAPAPPAMSDEPRDRITVTYRNWRGEIAERRICPLEIRFGSTQWHPEPQWLMRAFDVEKGMWRDFALKDMQFGPDLRAAPMSEELEAMRAWKDAAYEERNRVVAALAAIYPAGIKRTDIPGWSDDWHGCVYIDTPEGQLSWHYHDSQAHLFAHLPPYAGEWDGHTTEQKYERLSRLSLRAPAAGVVVPDAVKVKPLVWEEVRTGYPGRALTSEEYYTIEPTDVMHWSGPYFVDYDHFSAGKSWTWTSGGKVMGRCDTANEAKAEVQAHHEALILSQIEAAAPAGVVVPVGHLKEAMRFYPPHDHDVRTRLIKADLDALLDAALKKDPAP